MSTIELHVTEAGAGTPLVLLHAFPLSSWMWSAQQTALADIARVITPDLRGFGRSPLGVDEPSLDRSADDVAAVLDRLDLQRVVLGGLSMGGYVTMAFLRRHGERVAGLILADTKANADPPAAQDNRERIAQAVVDRGTDVLISDVFPTLLGDTTTSTQPDVTDRVRTEVQGASPVAVAWAQRAMADRPDSIATLAAVDVPALVIVGDEDKLSTVDDARAMTDALGTAQLVVVPQSGHLSAVEQPEAVTTAIREFVSGLGRV